MELSFTATELVTYLSVFISLCLMVALQGSIKRFRKQHEELQNQHKALTEKLETLQSQVDMINKGTLGMGRRLMNTEKRLNQTMERQDTLENKEADQVYFKQAARLFERGMEMDNVIEKVGITRSEAKLVDMFKQKQAVVED